MFKSNLENLRFYITIVISQFILISSSSHTITEEEGVLVLNKDNFNDAIRDNDHILIEFYAPWCGFCEKLAPKYILVAKQLKNEGSKIKLAKIDATVETELSGKFKIEKYPTLNFFIKGKPLKYNGPLNDQSIVSWLKLKQISLISHLNSVEETKQFINNDVISIVGFFKNDNEPEAQMITDLAFDYSDINFGISSNPAVLKEYEVDKDSLVLFRKADGGREELILTSELVKNFIKANRYPPVQEFSTENGTDAFYDDDVTKIMLLFISKKTDSFPEYLDIFTNKVLPQFKTKILFLYVNVDNEENKGLLDHYHVTPEDAPTYLIVDKTNGLKSMREIKYLSTEFRPEAITYFIQEALNGKLKPSLKFEPLPIDWDVKPVKVVVAKTLRKFLENKTSSKFIEYYAPWCGHCQKLEPIWEQLGEAYKDHTDIVIAKVDADANEFPDFKITSFPTLKYYSKDSSEAIDFVGERTLANFKLFLDSNGKEGNVETKEPEKKDEL